MWTFCCNYVAPYFFYKVNLILLNYRSEPRLLYFVSFFWMIVFLNILQQIKNFIFKFFSLYIKFLVKLFKLLNYIIFSAIFDIAIIRFFFKK